MNSWESLEHLIGGFTATGVVGGGIKVWPTAIRYRTGLDWVSVPEYLRLSQWLASTAIVSAQASLFQSSLNDTVLAPASGLCSKSTMLGIKH